MIEEYIFTKSILLCYSTMPATRKTIVQQRRSEEWKRKVAAYKEKLRHMSPEYIAELKRRKPEYFKVLERFGTSLNGLTEPRQLTGNGRGVGTTFNGYVFNKNFKLTTPANVAHLVKAKTNKNANKNSQTKKASPKKNRPTPSVRKIK